MDKIKIPINPDLASALSKIERDHLRLINATSGPLNRSIEAWKRHSYPFHTTQDVFNQMKFSAKDIYSSFEKFQNPLLSGDFGSAKIATIVNQSGIYDHLSAYTANWKENFNTILKSDFRIAVVSQELEQTIENGREEVTEKLLSKDTSKPSNELESQLFDILNEQRKIINDSFDILNKINNSQSKDITDKELDESHNSPAFYEDKMWYLEQIGANLIGVFVSAIVAATIGVDPTNTIVLALLLGCLVKFLK